MIELAEIIRRHGPEYLARFQNRILPSHRRALEDIAACRTAQLGGHVYCCQPCQQMLYEYHSCKNRHCPKCQNEQATRWLERQREWLLPTHYFLVTFTLPEGLRKLARSNQKIIYKILFQTAASSLKKLARDPHYVGGEIGMVGVLHMWKRDLGFHPHIHFLIPGGGVTHEGRWRFTSADYFLPVTALSKIFRAKFRDALKKAGLFASTPSSVWEQSWVVHCKPAGQGETVLKYFAPYIYRVAISNRRILKLENGQVTYEYREGKSGQLKTRTIPALDFISRFLQHVLPDGFVKVRYYGFLHPQNRKMFETILLALGGNPYLPRATLNTLDSICDSQDSAALPRSHTCPGCGQPMMLIETIPYAKRKPP